MKATTNKAGERCIRDDIRLAALVTGGFGIGVHALENLNLERSVTGFALRFEGSMQ